MLWQKNQGIFIFHIAVTAGQESMVKIIFQLSPGAYIDANLTCQCLKKYRREGKKVRYIKTGLQTNIFRNQEIHLF
jgi:hypothetical protein